MEIERCSLFSLEAKHFAIAVWIGAARLINGACLLVENDTLVAAQPEIGHDVGWHTEVAVKHGLVVLLRQLPHNRVVRFTFINTGKLRKQRLDVVGNGGNAADKAHILVP